MSNSALGAGFMLGVALLQSLVSSSGIRCIRPGRSSRCCSAQAGQLTAGRSTPTGEDRDGGLSRRVTSRQSARCCCGRSSSCDTLGHCLCATPSRRMAYPAGGTARDAAAGREALLARAARRPHPLGWGINGAFQSLGHTAVFIARMGISSLVIAALVYAGAAQTLPPVGR